MLRTLRILAAISVIWIVGFYLTFPGILRGAPFLLPWAIYSEVSSLGGELGFAVGILALVATASRRHVAWFVLFALLLALLHLLPLVIFRTPTTFLALYEAPLVVIGPSAWVILLSAMLPGVAFVYTLIVSDRTPLVAGVSSDRAN